MGNHWYVRVAILHGLANAIRNECKSRRRANRGVSSPGVDNVASRGGLLHKRQISPHIGVYSTVDRVYALREAKTGPARIFLQTDKISMEEV